MQRLVAALCFVIAFSSSRVSAQEEDRCRDILIETVWETTSHKEIRNRIERFATSSFERVLELYEEGSQEFGVVIPVEGVPLSFGLDAESLRHVHESIKSSWEQRSLDESWLKDFHTSFLKMVRPDQVGAWLECIRIKENSTKHFWHEVAQAQHKEGSWSVTFHFHPRGVASQFETPEVESVDLIGLEEVDEAGGFLKKLQAWPRGRPSTPQAAIVELRAKAGYERGLVAINLKNYPDYVFALSLTQEPEWTIDWSRSQFLVRPAHFQITDGNQTTLQFDVRVHAKTGETKVRLGDSESWNPGRQTIVLNSWSWYRFGFDKEGIATGSLAALERDPDLRLWFECTWARVRLGEQEREVVNTGEYVRSAEHRGKEFRLRDGTPFRAPFPTSDFSVSRTAIAKAAHEALKRRSPREAATNVSQRTEVSFTLTEAHYDSFEVRGVREFLIEYSVGATIVFEMKREGNDRR